MRRLVLALVFGVLASPAFACPSPLTGKDAGGLTQNFGVTLDGSLNCYGNIAIVDGAAAANKATVNSENALKALLGDHVASGTVTAVNNAVTASTQGSGVLSIDVSANTNVTLAIEGSVEGTTWVGISAYPVNGGAAITSITTTGQWTVPAGGFNQTRVRVTAVGTTPTATVNLNAGAGSTQPAIVVSPTAANFNATVAGTVTANQGGAPWSVNGTAAVGAAASGNPIQNGGIFNTTPATITSGQMGALQLTNKQYLLTTVTDNAGHEINIDPNGNLNIDIQTLAGVTLGAPSNYGTSPGAVAVAGVNAFVTNTVAVSGTVAATQSGTWTVQQGSPPWTIQGDSASGAANAGNPAKIGGVFNTTQPTVTTGQTVDAQYTARGAAIVATGVDAFAATVSGTVTANAGTGTFTVGGTVTANQGTSPWVDNITQFGGTNISTGTGAGGAGIPRMTVSQDSKVQPWDGTNTVSVKASGTNAATTDTALVVAQSPNPNTLCTSVISVSQLASTDLVTSTNKLHICSIVLVSATAQNIALIEGTGATCGTGTATLMGSTAAAKTTPTLALAANGGFSAVSDRAWLVTQTTADHLCLLQSGAGNVSGIITYTDHN